MNLETEKNLTLEKCVVADFTNDVFVTMIAETRAILNAKSDKDIWTERGNRFLEIMEQVAFTTNYFSSVENRNFARMLQLENVIPYIQEKEETDAVRTSVQQYLITIPGSNNWRLPSATTYEQHAYTMMAATCNIRSAAKIAFEKNKLNPLNAMKALRHTLGCKLEPQAVLNFLVSLGRALNIASSVAERVFNKYHCEVALYAHDTLKCREVESMLPEIKIQIDIMDILASSVFEKYVELHFDATLASSPYKSITDHIKESDMRIRSRKVFEGLADNAFPSPVSDENAESNPAIGLY